MGQDSASDADVDVVGLEEASGQPAAVSPAGGSQPTPAAEQESPGETNTPAQEAEDGADAAQGDDAAQGAEQTVKRGRGRPKKNFTAPIVPKGPKRGPGRPRNSELLARFANSHRPSGAPQLLPDLAPKPASAPAAGRKGGRGRARMSDGSRTQAVKRPPLERVSRLRMASGPASARGSTARGRGRGRRSRSAKRGSDDEEDEDNDIDDLLESDGGESGPDDLGEPAEDPPASQVSDPFPSDGEQHDQVLSETFVCCSRETS